MRIDIISIFPDYFAPLRQALLGKARDAGLLDIVVHDLRRWTHDLHRTVDDTPYGGGGGMVMLPQPWGEALDEIHPSSSVSPDTSPEVTAEDQPPARLIVPTPSGTPFHHDTALRYASESRLIFACGRYEGIDYRVVTDAASRMPTDEVSIGDYVLAGGEAAVLVMVEAITRLIPGVVGNAGSVADDSFATGLLEGPVYTKPQIWRDQEVPPVLLSGDHAEIYRWRADQALQRTTERRPELLPPDTAPGRV
ncbi:MAG: tRNA (guanosine(37)-N1)-methyltransferase TrmD [Mycobacteriales bacterium]